MTRSLMCKVLQRKTYDALGKRHTIVILFLGFVMMTISVLHFGESMMDWSRGKYSSLLNAFSDNIASKSFHTMLCQHAPIDVVYTWVNGTDPKHVLGLAQAKEEYGFIQPPKRNCSLSFCIESHMALVRPQLPKDFALNDLEDINPVFDDVLESFTISSPHSSQVNLTVLVFASVESVKQAISHKFLVLHSKNYTIQHAFVTSNWLSKNIVTLKNMFIVQNVPHNYTENQVLMQFPRQVQKIVTRTFLQKSRGIAIFTVTDHDLSNTIMMTYNNSESKPFSILPVNLVIELTNDHEDISDSRFADNEELRYSLRSLEKHAPWVKHIFIVTNGQIPYWLNLDNPRITIITHEEIFPNKSHLPTYSSPAIECHLHRIPNLSKKFLYLNDDVMFGKDVWPEDFFTISQGQKVYLSWPVPNCAEGCPSSWIRDGYCDKPCNNSQCHWDGGDCTMDNPLLPNQPNGNQNGMSNVPFQAPVVNNYCQTECSNSWLADKYCDKPCNTIVCGYDAGDCGTDNFYKFPQLVLLESTKHYYLPEGEQIGFFNLTTFIQSNFTITDAFYESHPVIRILTVSLKYSVLSVLLYPNYNTTTLMFTLKGERMKQPFERVFYLDVNTRKKKVVLPAKIKLNNTHSEPERIVFESFPSFLRYPKLLSVNMTVLDSPAVNISELQLPPDVKNKISELENAVKNDELTDKGYKRKVSFLIRNYTNFPVRTSQEHSPIERQLMYHTPKIRQRHLLDTFGDSLRHVNKLYNDAFGYEARKVPAHIAHFVDKDVMSRLSDKFSVAFDDTSSHKVRSSNDMQFAFSYYYFLMSEIENVELPELFAEFDVDNSGTWSDREIRTLLTRLHDLPLDFMAITDFEQNLINCSKSLKQLPSASTPHYERYYDSKLPIITKELVLSCEPISNLLVKQFGQRKRNRFEIVGEEEVSFKMIHNNISRVLTQIDDLRKTPKKFLCLNDNMNHGTPEVEMIKAVIEDFYESLFPKRSQFELPPDYRNRFLYTEDLREWRKIRDFIRIATYCSLALLILFSVISFCKAEVKPGKHPSSRHKKKPYNV